MESVHVASTPPSSFMYFPKLCPPTSTFSPVLPFYLIQINIVYISNLLPVACCHLSFFLPSMLFIITTSFVFVFFVFVLLLIFVFACMPSFTFLPLHKSFFHPLVQLCFVAKFFLQKDFSKLSAFQFPKIKMIEVYIGNWFCIAQIMFQSSIK